MIDQLFARPGIITRIQSGPCGPYLTPLAEALHQQGYAADSIRRILNAGDKFGRWLIQRIFHLSNARKLAISG